ncbi:MAG: YggU family protein, partial [Pseudomonas formosensis]|nr:YggU family protein [Halopseudomonas formosensis]
MAGFYQWRGADLLLDCHLQPGARSIGFAGQHGERLKIRISAPPVDGKANEMLLAFLAKEFDVG